MGFEVNTTIYPYFKWDDRVIEFVMETGYSGTRAGWSKERAYDLRTANPKAGNYVNTWQITDQTMEEFKNITDYAGNHSVVSLVYHFIS